MLAVGVRGGLWFFGFCFLFLFLLFLLAEMSSIICFFFIAFFVVKFFSFMCLGVLPVCMTMHPVYSVQRPKEKNVGWL